MILRGSMGLGDAVYLYPVVKYYADRGAKVTIVTRHPEIFAPLKCKPISELAWLTREQFALENACKIIVDCSCSARTTIQTTNIFEDTLIMAGVEQKLPFKIEYQGTKQTYATSKKICIIRTPTAPVKGEGETKVLIPDVSVYQKIINVFHDRVFFVLLGKKINYDKNLSGIDLDLSNMTGINNILGAIDGSNFVFTQPGHFVPMAEALGKKLFVVFARTGLQSQEKRFRFTTPQKILTRRESVWCIDDELENNYLKKFEELLNV